MSASFGDPRLPERFWAKVELVPFSTCWYWKGASWNGYGQFRVKNVDKTKLHKAHRYCYEVLVGPVPIGLDLDHFHCDTRACVNPTHVRPATRRENLLRGNTFTSRNQAKDNCLCGRPYDSEDRKGNRRCSVCFRASRRRAYYRIKMIGGEKFASYRRLQAEAKRRYRERQRVARQAI